MIGSFVDILLGKEPLLKAPVFPTSPVVTPIRALGKAPVAPIKAIGKAPAPKAPATTAAAAPSVGYTQAQADAAAKRPPWTLIAAGVGAVGIAAVVYLKMKKRR